MNMTQTNLLLIIIKVFLHWKLVFIWDVGTLVSQELKMREEVHQRKPLPAADLTNDMMSQKYTEYEL